MKKKTAKDKTTMTAREVAVLIEDLRSQFKVFGEGLDAVKAKVDSLFDQVGKLTEDVFVIKTDVRIIKADIAEIKETLKSHEKRLAQLETSPK